MFSYTKFNLICFSYTSILPNPGQTIHGKQFSLDFGGKGANQCIAAQKLGADTVFIGCVGYYDKLTHFKLYYFIYLSSIAILNFYVLGWIRHFW